MTYYYLGASLPLLLFDGAPPMPVQNFLDQGRAHMGSGDFSVVEGATTAPGPEIRASNETLQRYYEWEQCLRARLAVLRAERLEREVEPREQFGLFSPTAVATAQEAMESPTPLHGELHVLRSRWTMFDELEVGHYFDTDRMILYHLRLQVMWRRAAVEGEGNRDRGLEIFKNVAGEMTA